jgi:hypothetical protein
MLSFDINWVSLLLCGIAFMAIGMVWYSPAFFGNRWMKLSGLTKDKIDTSAMQQTYITSFLLAVVMAYVLSRVLAAAAIVAVSDGVMLGLWTGVGFTLVPLWINALYDRKPTELVFINAGYHLVTLMAMGAILTMWP